MQNRPSRRYRRAFFALTLSCLALAACGHDRARATASPPSPDRPATVSGMHTWMQPGVYRWTVPAADTGGMIEVEIAGGGGGGGNAGWVRTPFEGAAYTCQFQHDCGGGGGGGGGASAIVGGGRVLLVADGGGGGGGGNNHGEDADGGFGGFGQATLSTFLPIVANATEERSCPGPCVYAGETLTLTVGAGGEGALGADGGTGGMGFGGRGGAGGNRCSFNGQSGGTYGGGGGGGASCRWNLTGGAGGSGGFGGGGGAGALGGTNCLATGGHGGNALPMRPDPTPGFVKAGGKASGQSGRCGGGKGGAGHGKVNPAGQNGPASPGFGTYNAGAAANGHPGVISLVWS